MKVILCHQANPLQQPIPPLEVRSLLLIFIGRMSSMRLRSQKSTDLQPLSPQLLKQLVF